MGSLQVIPSVLLFLALSCPTSAGAARLGKLRGGSGQDAAAFELQLLSGINQLRARRKLGPLEMNEAARLFARNHAELGARGDPRAARADELIRAANLAPHGYRLQYAAGVKAPQLLRELEKDRQAVATLSEELAHIGVGAFWVPADEPYFQVAILVVREPDPMAGKPGLSREQTDAVMQRAAERIKASCYQGALAGDPNFDAEILFQLVIGAGGRVQSARLVQESGAAGFNGCALTLARSLQFPAPYKDKPVTLNHPMRFSPPQGDRRIGRLSQEQIASSFRAAAGDLQACYNARAEKSPRLAGTITLALTIAADGAVRALEVTSDELGDAELTACVKTRVQRLQFPKPDFGGDAEVSFPLRFEPALNQPGR